MCVVQKKFSTLLNHSGILMLGSQHMLGTLWSARELHHCTRDYIINTFVLSAKNYARFATFSTFWHFKRFHWNWSIANISFKIDLGYNNLWAIRNLLLFGILTEKMRRWPLNLYILRILTFYGVFYEIMRFLFSRWILNNKKKIACEVQILHLQSKAFVQYQHLGQFAFPSHENIVFMTVT